jgi:hypothetical protein
MTLNGSLKANGDYRISATLWNVGGWLFAMSIVALVLSNLYDYHSEFLEITLRKKLLLD